MNTASFLQRARSARPLPTLYWLGKGGWTRAEAAAERVRAQPGRDFDVRRELESMRVQRPQVHAAYLAALAESGLSLDTLPSVACDCSGFVCWALGVARDGGPWNAGWISTDTMHADARGAQRLFRPAERAEPGMMLVYPKPPGQGADGPPGHVGIVTEVTDGRPTRVLHCAPTNYLLPPADELPRNAIAETGVEQFYETDLRTLLVAWRAFDSRAESAPQ